MEITYSNQRFLRGELEEVLLSFYNVDEIRAICLKLLYPFLDVSPPERKQNKNVLVEVLLNVLEEPETARRFIEAMPERLRKTLTRLAWEGDCDLDTLEQKLGFTIARREQKKGSYGYQGTITEVTRLPNFLFIALENPDSYFSYASRHKQVMARLPVAIRRLVLDVLTEKPEGYEFTYLESVPQKNTLRFCCQNTLVSDLQQVSGFIDKGHLKVTQRGMPNKASLRKIAAICGGVEFFEDSGDHPRLEYLRTGLLVQLINSFPKPLRSKFASLRIETRDLRSIIDWIEDHPEWIFNHLLGHLSCRYDDPRMDSDSWLLFQEFIRNLKPEAWVTMENLERYHRMRGLNFRFCFSSYITAHLEHDHAYSYRHYSNKVELSDETSADLLEVPLIQGYCFLLAALGFAEIDYTFPPKHPRCPFHNSPYLTPFDGLRAVRLTKEGSYALGFDEAIELEKPEDPRTRIVLNPNCLNAICHEVDPVTELSLLDFMEKISPGHYRMTRTSFLGNSKTKTDAGDRLKSFRQSIAATLPPLWETFFQETVQTCVALKPVHGYRIFELENDPELRKRFVTDPVLRANCLKSEGFKVIIQNSKVVVVQKHLKKLGYILQ